MKQDFMFIRYNGRYIKIEFRNLVYIEAYKNYSKLHTTQSSYCILVTMKKIESILPAKMFCRIHRSFIAGFKYIDSFDKDSVLIQTTGFVQAAGKYFSRELPIGDQYRNQLESGILLVSREMSDKKMLHILEDPGE